MKKMVIIVVAALALSSFAHTNDLEKIVRRARVYVTNDAMQADCAYFGAFHATNAAFCAEMDEILSVKPPLYVLCNIGNARVIPRTYAAAIAAYAETKPVMSRAAREGILAFKLGNVDHAEWLVECYSSRFVGFSRVTTMDGLKVFKSAVGKCLGKLIVKTLRRQGKAIVTRPDGTSPVKEYADRISAALDAPRFEGLNEILAEMGIKARMDPSRLKTAEEANAIIAAIMDGDRSLGGRERFIIATALGTEAYNQFVERYNSGTR